jgi:hypothetical protein
MVVFIPGFQMIAQVRFKKTAHGGSQCSNGLLGRTGRDTNTGSFYFRLFSFIFLAQRFPWAKYSRILEMTPPWFYKPTKDLQIVHFFYFLVMHNSYVLEYVCMYAMMHTKKHNIQVGENFRGQCYDFGNIFAQKLGKNGRFWHKVNMYSHLWRKGDYEVDGFSQQIGENCPEKWHQC